MNYEKPEIVPFKAAIDVIHGQCAKGELSHDCSGDKTDGAAYEADE